MTGSCAKVCTVPPTSEQPWHTRQNKTCQRKWLSPGLGSDKGPSEAGALMVINTYTQKPVQEV